VSTFWTLSLSLLESFSLLPSLHLSLAARSTCTINTPTNDLLPRTTSVTRHVKGKALTILMMQEMTGKQRNRTMWTTINTDDHAITSSLTFYRPSALPNAKSTVLHTEGMAIHAHRVKSNMTKTGEKNKQESLALASMARDDSPASSTAAAAAWRPQCALKWDRDLKPILAIMCQCTSVTDRWTDGLASWHKREMYILHLALKNQNTHNCGCDLPDSLQV